MLDTLRKAGNVVGRGQWRKWALLIGIALILSGFEMVGAVMVYVLVDLASDPSGPIDLPVVGDIRRAFGDADDRQLLLGVAVALGAFFLIRAGVRVAGAYAQARVAQNAGARLSNRLVAGYLGAPYAFHLQRNSAELIRNSHQSVNQLVNQVLVPAIATGADSLLVLGLLVVLVSITPIASALAIAVIGGSATVLLLIVQPRLKRLGSVAHNTNRETLSFLQQGLHGIRDVKLLAKEAWFTRSYSRSRLRMARALYLRSSLAELPRTTIELALIGFILIFFTVNIGMGQGAESPLPVLGLFAYVGLRIQPSIQRIVGGLNNLKFATAPVEDLHADLSSLEEASSPKEPMQPLQFNKSIEFEEVSFRYEGAHADALNSTSLTIERGEEVGIVGPSGGGMTTLVDLLSGLLEPTSGRISVDGVDISTNRQAWQRNLGVIPQAVFLLDDTLRRNIAFGVEDEEVDADALAEAIGLAQLRDFVHSLPHGLDTTVGERGVRISGGQRQRIAIARALYRQPEVLIFDEGTSALDNTTEAVLMGSIQQLRGRHTIILVAHRLSTVRKSDRIVFLENGAITGDGTYDSLLYEHQSFRAMAGTGI